MDFDCLFDVGRVRFASGVDGEDPEDVLLSISQTCHHVVEVGALLWGLVGWSPLHSAGLLVLNKITKDPALSIVTGQLPLEADGVLGLIVGLGGHWGAGTHYEEKILEKNSIYVKRKKKRGN